MSNHREIHPDEEREGVQPEEPAGISRRRFLRDAALGAAAAGALLTFGEDEALAQEDTGDVTVSGIMLSYVGAPLGSTGSTSWTVQKSNAHTMRVVAAASRGISISADISAGITETFSVGGSTTFRQSASTMVTNAITLRRTTTQTITTPTPGVVGNTVIVGLLRPKMRFRGNTSSLRFKFLDSLSTFAITINDFQTNTGVQGQFDATTINSFLSQYAPLTDPTGATLVKPRYKLRLSILLSPGVTDVFTFTKASGSSFSDSKSATTSVEIVEKTGFSLFGLLSTTFSTGQRLEWTTTSVQEFTTDLFLTISTTLNRSTLGVNQVYWDRAWKTFVIIDKGAPNTSQPTVEGTVLDANGVAVAGAYVNVTQDNADWGARTDASGFYRIATPSGQPLSTGSYPIACGGTSQSVFIGSGTADADFFAVEPFSARQPSFNGETYNLN